MQINMNQAVAVCMANVKKRKQARKQSYTLHYAHNPNQVAGTMQGATIKELKAKFKAEGGAYRFAVITPSSDYNKFLRYFDREVRKDFFSMTSTKKKNK